MSDSGVLHQKFNPWFYDLAHAAAGRYSPMALVHYNGHTYYLNPNIGGFIAGDPNVAPDAQTNDWVVVSDPLFDEVVETSGTKTWQLSELPVDITFGIHAETDSGAQEHIIPSAWLAPGKEIVGNRQGSNDLTIKISDGTPIDGNADGVNWQFNGLGIIKVQPDGTLKVITALSDSGSSADLRVNTLTDLAALDVTQYQLGDRVTVTTGAESGIRIAVRDDTLSTTPAYWK